MIDDKTYPPTTKAQRKALKRALRGLRRSIAIAAEAKARGACVDGPQLQSRHVRDVREAVVDTGGRMQPSMCPNDAVRFGEMRLRRAYAAFEQAKAQAYAYAYIDRNVPAAATEGRTYAVAIRKPDGSVHEYQLVNCEDALDAAGKAANGPQGGRVIRIAEVER